MTIGLKKLFPVKILLETNNFYTALLENKKKFDIKISRAFFRNCRKYSFNSYKKMHNNFFHLSKSFPLCFPFNHKLIEKFQNCIAAFALFKLNPKEKASLRFINLNRFSTCVSFHSLLMLYAINI